MTRHHEHASRPTARRAIALTAALVLLAAASGAAWAQPWLTSLTPTRVSAGTGALVTVFGSGIGSAGDVVRFPGSHDASPSAYGSGWLTVVVPETYSGAVRVYSAAMGMWSANTLDINVNFTWTRTQWASGSFGWWLNQNGAPGNTFNAALTACASGYNSWQCQSGLNIAYNGATATLPNNHSDGVNVLGWMTCCWDPSTIAITDWTYQVSTGNIYEADISFNSQHYTWNTNGSATDMDIENIATHEEGHSVGFGDQYGAADNLDTMYGWSSEGDLIKRSLDLDDVEGSEYLYPHAGRPDLAGVAPAGWYAPVVPRPWADGSVGSVPLPASLAGGSVCYVSWSGYNAGADCASPHHHNHLYLDEAWTGWIHSLGGVLPPGAYVHALNCDVYVTGGRHTLGVRYDADAEVVESSEGNNDYRIQYVWSPQVLADQQTAYRAVPPEYGWFASPNCEGFQTTANWWSSVGIIPLLAGDDYDLRLFGDYANAVTGFATPLAYSSDGGQYTDFVLVNGNVAGYGATRQAGVVRYTAGSQGNYLLHTSNQVGGTIYPSDAYGAEVSTGVVAVGAYDVLKVHEVYLGNPATVYRFTLDCLSGIADLDVALYDAHTAHLGKGNYLAASWGFGPGDDEFFTYQPPSSGYYGVVVFKKNNGSVGADASYELRVGRALANLFAGTTPGGWSSPTVPRDVADATGGSAVLTATLPGNASGTYFNYSTDQQGPGATPGWGTRVYVDEEWYAAWSASPDPCGTGVWYAINIGPIDIRGGRHGLTHVVDYDGTVSESNEADNVWQGQWVWSPLVTFRGTPNLRAVPPARGAFANPNCDGAAFTRAGSYAWVTALAPLSPGDDYDLYAYDDYASSSSGFSNLRSVSASGGQYTDFVVGHYSGTPTTIYTGAVRYAAGAGGPFALDQSDALGRNSSATGSYPGQTLDANRLADVYEAYLTAGQSYRFLLTRTNGASDLSLAIFPGSAGGIYARYEAVAVGRPVAPDRDVVVFTVTDPDVTGWHPVVVFRNTGAGAGAPVTYDLAWGPPAATDVDDDGPRSPATLAFRGALPNPAAGPTTLGFSLPVPGRASLEVFDLRGRRVAVLADADFAAGDHHVAWDGRDAAGAPVPSGVYHVRLRAQGRVLTQQVSLVR